MARSVRRPFERVKMGVKNQSSRNGVKPRLIVIHSTESHNRQGLTDLQGIGNWFDNPSSQASSHVGVDNEGYSAKYVSDEAKAWTQAYFNSTSLSIEMIGQAAQSKASWLVKNRAQVKKVAKYLAYWSKKHDIPLRKGAVSTSTGRVLKPGVVRHSDLGQMGGDHHDPGANFPLDMLLYTARYYRRRGW